MTRKRKPRTRSQTRSSSTSTPNSNPRSLRSVQRAHDRQAARAERRDDLRDWREALGPLDAEVTEASRGPILECRITENFQETQLAIVTVARLFNGHIAAADFSLDFGFLGIRGSSFNGKVGLDEYRAFIDHHADASLILCKPEIAAYAICAAHEYGDTVGFPIADTFFSHVKLLGDLDPDRGKVPIQLGKDGKPHYKMVAGDNVPVLLDYLERRFGADGYSCEPLPGFEKLLDKGEDKPRCPALLEYDLHLSAESAVRKLASLSFGLEAEDVLENALWDDHGQVVRVSFLWGSNEALDECTAVWEQWGILTLDGTRLTIQVIDLDTIDRARQEIDSRLGDDATLRSISTPAHDSPVSS